MARDEFHFVHTLRVRYDEIDGQQIVYNARYLGYCDIAMAEYFREGLRLPIADLVISGGFDTATVHAELDYYRSFQLDDRVDVGVRCTAIGTTSLTFVYEMWKHGESEPCFRATVVYVNYDPAQHTKRPVPMLVREAIARLEQWVRV